MERMVKKDPKRYGLYHVGRCMYYIKGADHIDNNIVCIYICRHDASCIIYIYFSKKTSDFRCFLYTTKFWGLSGTSHGFSFSESPTGPTVFHHGGLAPTTQGSGEALFQALATSCTIAPVHWTHLSTEIYVSTAKILVYAVSLCLRNPDPSLSLFWPLYYLLNLCIYCMHIFLTRVFLVFFRQISQRLIRHLIPQQCAAPVLQSIAWVRVISPNQTLHWLKWPQICSIWSSQFGYDWDLPELQAPKFTQRGTYLEESFCCSSLFEKAQRKCVSINGCFRGNKNNMFCPTRLTLIVKVSYRYIVIKYIVTTPSIGLFQPKKSGVISPILQ